MMRWCSSVLIAAVLSLGLIGSVAAESDLDQTTPIGSYPLEVPGGPNAQPGFAGSGVIQYSKSGRGGMHFVSSIETNTPNALYWLVMNPHPFVDAEERDPTGAYQWWEIRTDANGVGNAAGVAQLRPGTWAFGGALTADLGRFLAGDFTLNVPLCFPQQTAGSLGPVRVTQ